MRKVNIQLRKWWEFCQFQEKQEMDTKTPEEKDLQHTRFSWRLRSSDDWKWTRGHVKDWRWRRLSAGICYLYFWSVAVCSLKLFAYTHLKADGRFTQGQRCIFPSRVNPQLHRQEIWPTPVRSPTLSTKLHFCGQLCKSLVGFTGIYCII